jgi:hypothetical protein
MFSQTWKKYIPLIALFLKKSAAGPQVVKLNQTDFERALGGRKIKLSFTQLQINKGRINSLIKNTPLAKDLADVLADDAATSSLLRSRNYSFSFSHNFELHITDITPEALPEETVESESNEEIVTK